MQEVPRRKALIIEVGALTGWVVLPMLLYPFVFPGFMDPFDHVLPWVNVHSGLATVGHILPLLFIIWASGDGWTAFGLGRVRWHVDGAIAITLFVLLCILALLPFQWPMQPIPEELRATMMPKGPGIALSIIFMAVVGAFFEELFFRGYLISRLEEITGNIWIGVVASSIVFAYGHLYQGVIATLGILGFGLVFGMFYVGRRNIWPLAVAHAAYNIFLTYTYMPVLPPGS